MSEDNRWNRPDTPFPPMFLNKAEKDFVRQIGNEIAEQIIGQAILYFPIDLQTTNYHPIYGEALEKSFLNPVRVFAYVLWEGENESSADPFMADKKARITVHFHKRRLIEDQNLFIRLGDFIQWGPRMFEIVHLEEPRQLFGQPDVNFEITAKCIQSRKGKFDAK